ncbi:MAG: CvfB family protein [Pontibacterium sp.]
MAAIGYISSLKVIREVGFGVYLDGGELGGVLLPKREVPEGTAVGQTLEVFIHTDSDDFPIATIRKPHLILGQVGMLRVAAVEKVGVFLDWGLPKQLLLPYSELRKKSPEKGQELLVITYLDNTGRICASTRLDRHLNKTEPGYKKGDEVQLVIAGETDLGYKAVVNNRHWGVLYRNQVFKKLFFGQRTKGYINQVREDGKIDLMLEKKSGGQVDDLQEKIIQMLNENRGFLALNDKTPPAVISRTFGVSKKVFKMAIGGLYKQRKIVIHEGGISFPDKHSS